jgi:hypothetical protein
MSAVKEKQMYHDVNERENQLRFAPMVNLDQDEDSESQTEQSYVSSTAGFNSEGESDDGEERQPGAALKAVKDKWT